VLLRDRLDSASGRPVGYPEAMNQMNQQSSSGGSLGRTVIAVLVLLVVGYFLLHVLIGVAAAIAGFVLVIAAIAAVVWALRVLL
jgi:hypothetical protein